MPDGEGGGGPWFWDFLHYLRTVNFKNKYI
jgi:hypothetical protein